MSPASYRARFGSTFATIRPRRVSSKVGDRNDETGGRCKTDHDREQTSPSAGGDHWRSHSVFSRRLESAFERLEKFNA